MTYSTILRTSLARNRSMLNGGRCTHNDMHYAENTRGVGRKGFLRGDLFRPPDTGPRAERRVYRARKGEHSCMPPSLKISDIKTAYFIWLVNLVFFVTKCGLLCHLSAFWGGVKRREGFSLHHFLPPCMPLAIAKSCFSIKNKRLHQPVVKRTEQCEKYVQQNAYALQRITFHKRLNTTSNISSNKNQICEIQNFSSVKVQFKIGN